MTKDRLSDPSPDKTLPSWRLDSLFQGNDPAAFRQFVKQLEKDAQAFAKKHKNGLSSLDGDGFATALSSFENLSERAALAETYLALRAAEGTAQDPSLVARVSKIAHLLMFFPHDINLMKETDLLDKMATPAVAAYAPWLRDVRAFREYQLAPELEDYLHLKSEVAEKAWTRIYDMTVADIRVPVAGLDLGLAQVMDIFNGSSDAALRRDAYAALGAAFAEQSKTLCLALNTLVDIQAVSDSRRNVAAEDGRHLENGISPEEAAVMTKAVRDAGARTAYRYYSWKAKKRGVSRLHPADRTAPFDHTPFDYIPFDRARDMVLDAFGKLSPDMQTAARRFFDEGWIDAGPRDGKSAQAFCHPAVPSAHPFVSMNYAGTPKDIMTLAHEIGHGIHQLMAAGQGHLKSKIPPPLAEIAGVFAEMTVWKALLDGEDDLYRRRALMAAKVEDMLENVNTRVAHYVFEQKVHAERRDKGELARERIEQIWIDARIEAFGPAINHDVKDAGALWGIYPDFIRAPFSSHTRPMGDCLALSLFNLYKNAPEDTEIGSSFNDMMKAGGAKRPQDALRAFGADLSKPDFWKKGMGVIESCIDDLMALDRKIEQIHRSKAEFRAAANDTVAPPAVPEKPAPRKAVKGPKIDGGGA